MVKISKSVKFVDYLHVTGGEPLLQVEALRELFSKVKSLGLMISLNTNLTLASELERLLKDGLLDHVATDLKVPFDIMSGLGEKARNYWGEYLKSLELLRGYEVTLELRVPVARGITLGALGNALREILPLLKGLRKSYCVVNPLIGPPVLSTRDGDWSRRYCNPPRWEVMKVADLIKRKLGLRTYVKKWW